MNQQNILLDSENQTTDEELAEFLGWFVGDGCISITRKYYEFTLTGDLKEENSFYKEIIIPQFRQLFQSRIKKSLILKEYKSVGVCGLYIFDRNFVEYLTKGLSLPYGKKKQIQIPSVIRSKKQKICFLRGLFDTDGSIYYCKSNYKSKNISLHNIFHYKPKIKLCTISKPLIYQVHELLSDLGFHPRFRKPTRQREKENMMYGVTLYRNKDTERWINEIGFRNPKHLTKILISRKYGFCPPYTKIKQRYQILNEELNPLSFYKEEANHHLKTITDNLLSSTSKVKT